MASSLGKAFVEVEANADKVGPEIERRFSAALNTIASAAEAVFDDVADDSATAANLIAEAFEETGASSSDSLRRVGVTMAGTGDDVAASAEQAAGRMTAAFRDGAQDTGRALQPMVAEAEAVGEKAGDAAGKGLSRKLAAGAAVAAAAAGAALGTAIAGAMDVEAANDKLAAQLGLNGPRAAELGAVAGRLYGNAYGENLGEVNTAVGAVVSSIGGMRDASGPAIEALTTRALDFATAFETDVTGAAGTAGLLLKNGLARDGEQAFDLLTRAFQTVPAAMREELPAILNEYGTSFRALGFTGEQAFALLGGAAEGGAIVLDKVGDSLKEFTIRATDGSATSVAAYERIGLSAGGMANAILAGGDKAQTATSEIAAGILAIEDPAERAQTAIALFGTPLEDLSVDQIPAFLSSIADVGPGMTDAAGAVDKLGETLNDNAATNLSSFGRQAKQVFVDIVGGQALPAVSRIASELAERFGPAVSEVGGWISGTLVPALSSAVNWFRENETAITIIAGVIAVVFLPHLVALGVQYTITTATAVWSWTVQKGQAIAAAIVHSAQIAWMILRFAALSAAAVLNAGFTVGAWIGMGIAAVVHAVAIAAIWTAQTTAAGARVVAGWAITAASTLAAWIGMAAAATANALRIGAVWLVQTAITGATVLASYAVMVAGVIAGWVLMGVQSLINAARMAAAWLIAMGPIGWAIAAVIGLAAVIIANWDKIKAFTVSVFGAIGSFVSGIWDGLGSGLRSAINGIIRVLNSGIGGINSIIGGVNKIPGVDLPTIPKIPLLAEGAIIRRPTLAVVGEDGPEVVLPLSARRAGRRRALMDQVGLSGGQGGAGEGYIDARQYYTVADTQTAEEVGAVVGGRIVRDVRNGVASRYGTGTAA